jgi:signal transduction histidine kinase
MDEAIVTTIRLASVLAFVALAAVAMANPRRSQVSGRWAAAAFAAIAAVSLSTEIDLLLDVATPEAVRWIRLVLLLAFPYLLLRFTASLVPLPTWVEIAAGSGFVVTTVVVASRMGTPGSRLVLVVGLSYWLLVSLVIVVRLWGAGRRQPCVTRWSMRLMAIGAGALAVTLLGTLLVDRDTTVRMAGSHLGALASAVAFGLGYRPPEALRRMWRQEEEDALRVAALTILRARTADEVASQLLEPLVRIVNGVGAVLLGPHGQVVASHGDTSQLQPANRARQEADRANQAKSEFLSRMSHELRTPLNAVLGFGQLLEESALSQDDTEMVEHIVKAGRHLLDLINDVLDLSRIEAGSMTISVEPVHVGELVRDTVALVRPMAADRQIALQSDAEDCDEFVRTDRQRARQVLLNLLSNAIKYNHDGGRVEVTCSPGGWVRSGCRDRHGARASTQSTRRSSSSRSSDWVRRAPRWRAPAWGWHCPATSPNGWAAASTWRARRVSGRPSGSTCP